MCYTQLHTCFYSYTSALTVHSTDDGAGELCFRAVRPSVRKYVPGRKYASKYVSTYVSA